MLHQLMISDSREPNLAFQKISKMNFAEDAANVGSQDSLDKKNINLNEEQEEFCMIEEYDEKKNKFHYFVNH